MNLKQLSDILGLSPTTVSRALNGYPEVSEETRQRVLAAARAHNYRPSARAKALATGRSMAIGHVMPISSQHEMMNPVFADFVAGAAEVYAREGYEMLLSLVRDDDEERSYRELAARGSVDGIIVHAPRRGERRIRLLHELGLPFVVHGRASDERADYNWVDVNNRRAFRRATRFLLDLGHRRIALVNGIETMDFAIRRRAGYLEALAEAGVPADPRLMRADEMTEVYGHDSAREMLALEAPPTAFLVSSMITAIGVRRAAEEVGLRLGRDVSIVTHDDDLSYFRNGGDEPIFTATRSSVRDAGRIAAEVLIGVIRNPGAAPVHRMLEAELIVGQSTGPAPAG
ncbi:MAG: LacI family DNA-binding transcriptional regulator [Alphaproteobacteria bacterium]|nr:MAG: LacI family DNA-binding transcriptional regulator [Alphaproteobacteria bacterium]